MDPFWVLFSYPLKVPFLDPFWDPFLGPFRTPFLTPKMGYLQTLEMSSM